MQQQKEYSGTYKALQAMGYNTPKIKEYNYLVIVMVVGADVLMI